MDQQDLKVLTLKELAQFDGRDGRPAYVAFRGKVYDVTKSTLWKNGKHVARHLAGEDLTERMINAPHDESKLTEFPVVGTLASKSRQSRYIERLQEIHPHPMVVHFSEVLPIMSAFFALVFVIGREGFFEEVSFILIMLSGLSALGCMTTGFFSWTVGYERRLTRVFIRKIVLSSILTFMILVLLAWRSLQPEVLTGHGGMGGLYLSVVLAMVPVTVLLGHYGGKIVYG